jgi:hypothetical protein
MNNIYNNVLKLGHLAIILTLLFISCGNKIDNTKVKGQGNVESENVSADTEEKQPQSTQFYIKDEKQYSETFLAEFKARHSIYETVALIGDPIIINNDQENFILIPTDLPLDRLVTYEESADGIKYTLTVKRINLSTLEYGYFETVNGKKENEKQGQADIEPVFYFGAEGTFEDENENTYRMNEYINSSKNGCQTLIYIGVGSIEKSFLKQHCKSETNKFKTPLLAIKK